MKHHSTHLIPTLWMALLLAAAPAWATNGMYLAGNGSQAAGRGGANIAISDCALGLQSNPAGLATLCERTLDVDAQFLAPSLRYGGDPLGNRMDGDSKVFAMPALSYAQGGKDSPWTWGVALISQGGMGATFSDYATPFGTRDRTSSEVRYATLTPTLAYRIDERFSLGASLNAGYSDVTFAFWPGTSFYNDGGTPADPTDDVGFFGADMTTRARALTLSVRGGAMWHVNPMLTLGAVAQSATNGDYTDGVLSLDQTALGLGSVHYDAKVEGFGWPAQLGLGLAVRPAPGWRLAADLRRYFWEGAMERIVVRGGNPDAASPVSTVEMPFEFDWNDQWVTSIGAELAARPTLTLRAGWNQGDSPVPDGTLNPLFPATTIRHASGGLTWRPSGHALHLGVEHAFEAEQVNPNTSPQANPFGPGMFVDHSQWTFSVGYSRAF